MPDDDKTATKEQLRDDIDSGRTRDKVAHNDPAASPLGTDDEAGGASDAASDIAKARREETRRD